jgi:ATP-dependent Clp protease adaptor protein ClpS
MGTSDSRLGDIQDESDVATKTRTRVARPKRYKVVLYNDDYTSMEFVTHVLERVFDKSPSEATAIMLSVHRAGQGVAGVYILEVAETKVAIVHQLAEKRSFPLRAGLEEE